MMLCLVQNSPKQQGQSGICQGDNANSDFLTFKGHLQMFDSADLGIELKDKR